MLYASEIIIELMSSHKYCSKKVMISGLKSLTAVCEYSFSTLKIATGYNNFV